MMLFWLFAAVVCSAGSVFLVVWAVGDWLTSWRRVWIPTSPGPGLQHGEYVDFVSPIGDAAGIIRIPWDIAPRFTVPWGTRVDTPWGSVMYHEEVTSP